jgi:hypothetical protein|tara:strand:- start:4341 stop:4901 length:561 start_codon:yes stop_codon:yes gene_type:complete
VDEKIKIYLGGELAHLYELGYISTDLHQLAAFGEMVEESRTADIERFFLKKRPTPINRYTKLTGEKRPRRTEVLEVRPGSIELILGVSTLVASIAMPLVAIRVNRELQRRDVKVQFNISPQDARLKRALDAYEAGTFGDGEDGLQLLFSALSNDYDVTALGPHLYEIEHVVDQYSRRIVRTISKFH